MFTDKKILILDMDETLVHYSESEPRISFDYEKLKDGYYVCFRPHLFPFLLAARNRFDQVILWSCGEHDYVHEIVEILNRRAGSEIFHQIYTIRDVSWLVHKGQLFPFKDLYKLIERCGFETEECIMLDDGILISSYYPDIVHQVPRFEGKSSDIYDRQLEDFRDKMTN